MNVEGSQSYLERLFMDSSEPSDPENRSLREVIFNEKETITETKTGDELVGHQTFEYIVQVVYNLLVIIHKIAMEKTHYMDLDEFTALLVSPKTGHSYSNPKSESIGISLKIVENAGAIKRMNTLVGFDGTKNKIHWSGIYTADMLWQDAKDFVTKSGYKKNDTQKTQGNALVPTNIVSNITMMIAEKGIGVMKTKAASVLTGRWEETGDDDMGNELPFHYNTRKNLPKRDYMEFFDHDDEISALTEQNEDSSWTGSSNATSAIIHAAAQSAAAEAAAPLATEAAAPLAAEAAAPLAVSPPAVGNAELMERILELESKIAAIQDMTR